MTAHADVPLQPATSLPRELLLARVLLVGVAYHVAARASIELSVPGSPVSPVWIASAIAVVAVLAWGRSMAVGVFAGELTAALVVGANAGQAVGFGIGNALEPVVIVWLLQAASFDTRFRRLADVPALAVAAMVGACVSATFAIGSLVVAGMPFGAVPREWGLFWASVVLGVVLITPALLVWLTRDVRRIPLGRALLGAASALVLVAVAWLAFRSDTSAGMLLLMPVFVWTAIAFEQRGAATATLLVTIASLAAVVDDQLAFSALELEPTGSAIAVQVLLALVGVANLTFAVLVQQRDSARRRAEHVAASLAHAQRLAGIGSWELPLESERGMRWSDELRRMLGAAADEEPSLEGLLQRIPDGDRDELEAAIARCTRTGDELQLTHRIVADAGPERVVSTVGRVVTDAGARTRPTLIATSHDVTQRVALDRLRDALIASASHELRTPLTSIVGFAQTLLDRWDEFEDEQRIDYIDIIGSQGRRLSALVDDMLVQSRIDSGTLSGAREPYALAQCIARALRDIDAADDVEVRADRALVGVGNEDHLVQIVINLVTNARKYGAGPIVVEAERLEDRPEQIAVRVVDHGAGVPPAYRERLFERFTRGPGTEAMPGTGLGLSIVRGLAESGGGTATYRREGDRSVFEVTVQAHRSATTTAAPTRR